LYPDLHNEHCWLEELLHVTVLAHPEMAVHFLQLPEGEMFHVILP
jgi:hypothetical protein